MKRYRLPLLLGVGFFVLGQVISALLNIWTSRIPTDTPYLEYTPHLLLAAIVVGVAVFALQYRAERRAEADRPNSAIASLTHTFIPPEKTV
ncbi:MAG TPA: hypothetical protein VFS21_36715 [Roseiflexaceae bacterium]|nr:hypothetical protein [Roseiflexaceae bacterium]